MSGYARELSVLLAGDYARLRLTHLIHRRSVECGRGSVSQKMVILDVGNEDVVLFEFF